MWGWGWLHGGAAACDRWPRRGLEGTPRHLEGPRTVPSVPSFPSVSGDRGADGETSKLRCNFRRPGHPFSRVSTKRPSDSKSSRVGLPPAHRCAGRAGPSQGGFSWGFDAVGAQSSAKARTAASIGDLCERRSRCHQIPPAARTGAGGGAPQGQQARRSLHGAGAVTRPWPRALRARTPACQPSCLWGVPDSARLPSQRRW